MKCTIKVYLKLYILLIITFGAALSNEIKTLNSQVETISKDNKALNERVKSLESQINKNIISSSKRAVHFDETGIYIDKKRQWLHVSSDENFTYYESHEKRGKEAIDKIGVLPNFTGTAVHDGFKTYNKYTNCKHALCNAHILRELNGILELQNQEWAKPMKDLLLEIKKEVDLSFGDFSALPSHKIEKFEVNYDEILNAGFKEDYAKNIKLYSQKTVKRSVSLNLLNRLSGYKNQILAFMYDFNIPFDNNLAERDLRMDKLKQKISGTFRSFAGAIAFTRIRGYVSTVRKQDKNALDCLVSVFGPTPVNPTLI